MGKKKDIGRGHSIVVDIPEKKYKRWKVLDDAKRVILIDFRCIRTENFKPVDYGGRNCYIWNSPEQLKGLIDEYFESCYGPVRNPKSGEYLFREDGSVVIGQIKPFTISGLALYTHLDSKQLRHYSAEKINALGVPTDKDYQGLQYSDILIKARRKVENYAEEQLYSRDGFNGGRFVLDCAFSWIGQRDLADIKALKKQLKLKQKELELREQQLLNGEAEEEPINITVKRAGE